MDKRVKRSFITAGVLFVLFLLLTVAVLTIDVKAVGPQSSTVGLAAINEFIFKSVGVNLIWHQITDWVGLAAIAVACGFAVFGVIQLIKRKSLKRVDKNIVALGIFYVAVALFYIFFELVVINYRPVLMDGKLEASFPSTHSMIVLCIMGTAMIQFCIRIQNKLCRIIALLLSFSIIAVTVIGRFISGVHWFTDIMGGLLLGSALVVLYSAVIRKLEKPVVSDIIVDNEAQ